MIQYSAAFHCVVFIYCSATKVLRKISLHALFYHKYAGKVCAVGDSVEGSDSVMMS